MKKVPVWHTTICELNRLILLSSFIPWQHWNWKLQCCRDHKSCHEDVWGSI